jgi:hypothetical protein
MRVHLQKKRRLESLRLFAVFLRFSRSTSPGPRDREQYYSSSIHDSAVFCINGVPTGPGDWTRPWQPPPPPPPPYSSCPGLRPTLCRRRAPTTLGMPARAPLLPSFCVKRSTQTLIWAIWLSVFRSDLISVSVCACIMPTNFVFGKNYRV